MGYRPRLKITTFSITKKAILKKVILYSWFHMMFSFAVYVLLFVFSAKFHFFIQSIQMKWLKNEKTKMRAIVIKYNLGSLINGYSLEAVFIPDKITLATKVPNGNPISSATISWITKFINHHNEICDIFTPNTLNIDSLLCSSNKLVCSVLRIIINPMTIAKDIQIRTPISYKAKLSFEAW